VRKICGKRQLLRCPPLIDRSGYKPEPAVDCKAEQRLTLKNIAHIVLNAEKFDTWLFSSGKKIKFGGAGYRSRYFSHAKRALYHLSYAPS
jgi:hypothetical protein